MQAVNLEIAAHPVAKKKLNEIFVNSLSDYFAAIKSVSKVGGVTWFRGQSKRSYKLQPGLFRHPDIENSQTPHIRSKELESLLMERFRNQSLPFVGDKFSHEDDWGLLFFMQHYRVPTRLLDWSYSPLVALYFAVSTVRISNGVADEPCTVWALHPESWNAAALAFQKAPSKIFGTKSTESQNYRTQAAYNLQDADAIAIEGIHNSPRIVAQQGAFTIFGPTTKPLESQFLSAAYPEDALQAISVKPEAIGNLKLELMAAGILETTIFPDLEGLAIRLRRELNFQG